LPSSTLGAGRNDPTPSTPKSMRCLIWIPRVWDGRGGAMGWSKTVSSPERPPSSPGFPGNGSGEIRGSVRILGLSQPGCGHRRPGGQVGLRFPAPTKAVFSAGDRALARNAEALLGQPPPHRSGRIMVTLPPEAAEDSGLLAQLLERGMDLARINLAHDGPEVWERMLAHLRQAQAIGFAKPPTCRSSGPPRCWKAW
jgi:hypothetical protein